MTLSVEAYTMTLAPVKAYAEARIEILQQNHPESGQARAVISELEMIVVLCDGLTKQEALIREAIGNIIGK